VDSQTHAEEDVRARLLTEQRVEAERIAAATRAALADSPELLDEGERPAIEGALAALDAAKAGTNHHAIREAVEAVDRASKEFATRRMNRALEGVRGKGVAAFE
jgi:molecular chaperone HscA